MRLLHVITALGVGGAEQMLLKLLRSESLGHVEQRVVAMLPGGAMADPMRRSGVRVDELNFLGGAPVIGGAVRLAGIAREFSPHVVQGWLYHGNLGAAMARATLRAPASLIWGIRQSLATLEGENLPARSAILLNKLGSGLPDRVLFNSRTSMAEHRACGFRMERSEYLPNGFDTRFFAPSDAERKRWRRNWNVEDGATVFGMFARYHPAKDHASFLAAARRVRQERHSVCFVMAGTGVGQENATLKKAVREAGLAECTHLLGERNDVASLFAALDVYVSSSARVEAFSNSVGEAMSCGIPCIVTDVGDSPGIVADTGRVVPPRDPEALASAMIALMDMGPIGRESLGARARTRVVAEFDIEAVAARYAALYRELTLAQRTAS